MKILILDIETSPNLGYTWGKYEQNVIKFVETCQIICIAWKWLGEKETYVMALPDYSGYRPPKINDKKLVKDLWKLLDRADCVMAHNGDRFDVKMANARFIAHELRPPSYYTTIDTKKIAKAAAMFPSNKLGDLGPYLGVGTKMQTGGFDLWEDCMAGDKAAWKKMKAYNKQDVDLLEEVYLRLRPWAKSHPNLNAYNETSANCTRCGSHKMQKRGFQFSRTGSRPRFQCQDCGGWSVGPHKKLDVVLS